MNTLGCVSRGEYGARVGVPRLLSLLDKYHTPTTWFVPGHTVDTYPELVGEINARGHEIAHHGYGHRTPTELSESEELEELLKGIESIKSVVGQTPKGYRAPSWDISSNTIRLLCDHGFRYDSSLMGDDYTPYKCRIGDKPSIDKAYEFGKEVDLIEFPPAWSLSDWEHFEYTMLPSSVWPGLRAASAVQENWEADFQYMYENVPLGVLTLTMHPQVIGRGHRIMMLERLIRNIASKPGVYFTRLTDLASSWKD